MGARDPQLGQRTLSVEPRTLTGGPGTLTGGPGTLTGGQGPSLGASEGYQKGPLVIKVWGAKSQKTLWGLWKGEGPSD